MLIAIITALLFAAPPAPDTLVDQAEELALNAACGRNPECRTRRATEAKAGAATVMDACGLHIPRRHCLTLVATLAESQMNAYPTCSPERCRQLCGMDASGGSRRCRVKCATAISDRARVRADKCNDSGTSRGWLQMKRGLLRSCERAMAHPIDPHDLGQAAHCYAWIVGRSFRSDRCGVYEVKRRWGVSFARVAAGPYQRSLVSGQVLRLPRCMPHGYARQAAHLVKSGPRRGEEYPRAVNLEPVKAVVVP